MDRVEKRAVGAALLSGVLMAAASPGMNLHLLGWVCLVPVLISGVDKRPFSCLVLGWISGFLFHLGLVYWVIVSMTFYGGIHWLVSVTVLVLFALFLGLFTALPLSIYSMVRCKTSWRYSAVLPLAWTAVEYVKSWVFTGFPWDNLGHSQFQQLMIIQIADSGGVWVVSFLVVAVNCAIAEALVRTIRRDRLPWPDIVWALLLLVGAIGYGYVKLAEQSTAPSGLVSLRVSMVQPNIPQDLKWNPAYLEATLDTFRSLTSVAHTFSPGLIIWPESAMPFFYEAEPAYKRVLHDIVSRGTAYLLFGSPSFEQTSAGQRFFNSAYLLSPNGEISGKYDKIHLVPYGEYVPLKHLFPFLEKMVQSISDFTPGSEIRLLPLPVCRLGTVICYEIIFPDLVRQFVAAGAQVLVNITNDAWFGSTSAPVQHLAIAVFRAIENRRWIARCANTGISAFISPEGRIRARTDIFTEAVLSDVIYCSDRKTLYTQWGDFFAKGCCGAVLCMLGAGALRGSGFQDINKRS